jgi:hypothetical protein
VYLQVIDRNQSFAQTKTIKYKNENMFPSAGTDANIRIEKKAKLIPKSKEEKLVLRVKNLHVNFAFLYVSI